MLTEKVVKASELQEGNEILLRGTHWVVLEEVEVEGDEVRIWGDCGNSTTLNANDEVTVAC